MEAVRLVIWDLDETFWQGTVTEGGITEYSDKNHQTVIELAKRGIMSSICSKNDFDTIKEILTEKGLWDYFVFPSISWDHKGVRVRQIVEDVQLRSATIMFIDDNPNNRAEVLRECPGVQIEDDTFVAKILSDKRFKGKRDPNLSRLKQYKLLEQKKVDEVVAGGDSEEFLKSCGVKVYIEYDIKSNVDRAIELINRTNQLNFTKKRLPEDADRARELLLAASGNFDTQAGLVKVIDKYGDYGFVGFFLLRSMRTKAAAGKANSTLVHFCFSCRTLGMLVEKWIYDYLGQPELDVVGDVITDVFEPKKISWIALVDSPTNTAEPLPAIADRIVVWGGCEANAVGVYLGAYTPKLEVFGNFVVGGCFLRITSAAHVLAAARISLESVAPACVAMEIPPALIANDVFSSTSGAAVYVFNLSDDPSGSWGFLKHKDSDMLLSIEPRHAPRANMYVGTPEWLDQHIMSANYSEDQEQQIRATQSYIKEHFEQLPPIPKEQRKRNVLELIKLVPQGSKVIFVLDHFETRRAKNELVVYEDVISWGEELDLVASNHDFVGVVRFSDVIESRKEIQTHGNHYDRQVYLRLANKIVDVASKLSPKPSQVKTVGPISEKIVIWGGYEANILSSHLRGDTRNLDVYGNTISDGLFVRTSSAEHVLAAARCHPDAVESACTALRIPISLIANDIFSLAERAPYYVFNLGDDATRKWGFLKNAETGMMISVEPRHAPRTNIGQQSHERLLHHLSTANYTDDERKRLVDVQAYLKSHFETVQPESIEKVRENTLEIIRRLPSGAKAVFILDHYEVRQQKDQLIVLEDIISWGEELNKIALQYPFIGISKYSDAIEGRKDILLHGMYNKQVYANLAENIRDIFSELTFKP